MKISVGLPTTPEVPDGLYIDWARQADEIGFHTLGMIDRIVYPNHEVMVSLTAAAAVTKKIRLMPTVMAVPPRGTGLVAKQIATLDRISQGRVSLGFGVGARQEDFEINDRAGDFAKRGRRLEMQVALMKDIWAGKKVAGNFGYVGPSPRQSGGPEILLGGYSPNAFARAGRIADGFITGGVPDSNVVSGIFKAVDESWRASKREGKPRHVSCTYYALGDGAVEKAGAYFKSYYGDFGETALQGLQSSPAKIKETLKALASIGADEMILWPTIPDIRQLDLLKSAIPSDYKLGS